jgi:hypothetical protein
MATAGHVHFHAVELGEIHPRARSITSTTLPPPTSVALHLPPVISSITITIVLVFKSCRYIRVYGFVWNMVMV